MQYPQANRQTTSISFFSCWQVGQMTMNCKLFPIKPWLKFLFACVCRCHMIFLACIFHNKCTRWLNSRRNKLWLSCAKLRSSWVSLANLREMLSYAQLELKLLFWSGGGGWTGGLDKLGIRLISARLELACSGWAWKQFPPGLAVIFNLLPSFHEGTILRELGGFQYDGNFLK